MLNAIYKIQGFILAKSSSLNVSLLYISVFVVVIDELLEEENKIFWELGIQAARLLEGFYYIIISKKELWIYGVEKIEFFSLNGILDYF